MQADMTLKIIDLLNSTSKDKPEVAIQNLANGLSKIISEELQKAKIIIPATEGLKMLYVNTAGVPTPITITGFIVGSIQQT